MIDLYTWSTPNGHKVSIMLEECGLDYTVHAINLQENKQFEPDFLAISPNNKIPAIIDQEHSSGPLSVFESGAILIYLANKVGRFFPKEERDRMKVLEWLMWQMSAVGPMIGQLAHFAIMAEEKVPYAIDRFQTEAFRLMKILNTQLDEGDYIAGDYSIADIATFSWVQLAVGQLKTTPGAPDVSNIEAWVDRIKERPAVQRGLLIPTDEQKAAG